MERLLAVACLAVLVSGCAAHAPAPLAEPHPGPGEATAKRERGPTAHWTEQVRGFYRDNADLVGRERCVARVWKARFDELKDMPVDDGFATLAHLAREACVPGSNWTRVAAGEGVAYIDFSSLERNGATVVYWARWEGRAITVDYNLTREIANCSTRMVAQLHFSAYEAGAPTIVSNEPQGWQSAPPGSVLESVLRAACAAGTGSAAPARKPTPPRDRTASRSGI
jgi:hypothetical protein